MRDGLAGVPGTVPRTARPPHLGGVAVPAFGIDEFGGASYCRHVWPVGKPAIAASPVWLSKDLHGSLVLPAACDI